MKYIFSTNYKYIYLLLSFLIISFFIYQSKNFKLDASSDTLILQNDESFKYFNYYNNIFPSRNFLILAVKSEKKIDDIYIKKIREIKKKISIIEGVENIFTILDAPILISNNIKLS